MARPRIEEQIIEAGAVKASHPKYAEALEFHGSILKTLMPVAASPTMGGVEALSDAALENLVDKAFALKKPIISFLDVSLFDSDVFFSTAMKIVEVLADRSSEMKSKLEEFTNALKRGEVDAGDAVKGVLKEDAEWFNRVGKKFSVEPPLILFIFETPLKPFFEDLSRKVEERFIEKWWELFCPVCGRLSSVARARGMKRYIVCTYCGTQYLVDLFKCINCGNNDPESQGFIGFEEYPEYELNYCEKCGYYIKAIVEDKQYNGIPQGLEDLLTRELDEFAKNRNLECNRQK